MQLPTCVNVAQTINCSVAINILRMCWHEIVAVAEAGMLLAATRQHSRLHLPRSIPLCCHLYKVLLQTSRRQSSC